MSKRKRVRETKERKEKAAQVKKAEKHSDDENSDHMDFGGMPERNLKKNLGCG